MKTASVCLTLVSIFAFLCNCNDVFASDYRLQLKVELTDKKEPKRYLKNQLGKTNSPLKKAIVCNFLGMEFQKEFALDSALYYHKKAETLLKKKHPRHIEMAITLNKMGIVAIYSEDYSTAATRLRKALNIFKPSAEKANTYNNLALALKYQGKPDEAIEAYSKALILFEKYGKGMKAIDVRLNISALHSAQDNLEIALEQLKSAEEKAKIGNWKEQEFRAKSEMASLYRKLGDYEKSRKLHTECDAFFSKNNYLEYQIVNLNNLAILYGELKEYREEIGIYRRLIKICETHDLKNQLIALRANLGSSLILTNELTEAIFQLEEAEKLANETNNSFYLLSIYESLGEALKKAGKSDLALDYREKEISLRDSLKEVERLKALVTAESKMKNRDLKNELSEKEKEVSSTTTFARKLGYIAGATGGVALIIFVLYFLKKRNADRLRKKVVDKDKNLEQLNDKLASQDEIIESLSDHKKLPYPKNLTALTEREKEVLEHLSSGMTDQEIADKMHLSPATIRTHLRNGYAKIDVKNRAQATQFVRDHQL